jgi:hypothetical protein
VALLAALRGLGWLDERQWEAVLPAATVEVHGGGRRVGAVRPARLDLRVFPAEPGGPEVLAVPGPLTLARVIHLEYFS